MMIAGWFGFTVHSPARVIEQTEVLDNRAAICQVREFSGLALKRNIIYTAGEIAQSDVKWARKRLQKRGEKAVSPVRSS